MWSFFSRRRGQSPAKSGAKSPPKLADEDPLRPDGHSTQPPSRLTSAGPAPPTDSEGQNLAAEDVRRSSFAASLSTGSDDYRRESVVSSFGFREYPPGNPVPGGKQASAGEGSSPPPLLADFETRIREMEDEEAEGSDDEPNDDYLEAVQRCRQEVRQQSGGDHGRGSFGSSPVPSALFWGGREGGFDDDEDFVRFDSAARGHPSVGAGFGTSRQQQSKNVIRFGTPNDGGFVFEDNASGDLDGFEADVQERREAMRRADTMQDCGDGGGGFGGYDDGANANPLAFGLDPAHLKHLPTTAGPISHPNKENRGPHGTPSKTTTLYSITGQSPGLASMGSMARGSVWSYPNSPMCKRRASEASIATASDDETREAQYQAVAAAIRERKELMVTGGALAAGTGAFITPGSTSPSENENARAAERYKAACRTREMVARRMLEELKPENRTQAQTAKEAKEARQKIWRLENAYDLDEKQLRRKAEKERRRALGGAQGGSDKMKGRLKKESVWYGE